MCLKDDKERLLRMVSRLELERHHLQSLQINDSTMPPAPSGSTDHLCSEAYAKEQLSVSATSAKANTEMLYVGALTDLIELNDE